MVTGGLGGLGLIASFHCAAEFDNPIITTSRSGRLGSGGAAAMNLFEALKEMVPVYNVRLDVGNSKDMADVFAWLSRPGQTPEDSKIIIDDVVNQVKYKLHSLPDEALRLIQEFLLEVKDKLQEVIAEMRRRETKLDQSNLSELLEKDEQVSHAISLIRGKVGGVARSGQCRLIGGLVQGSYSVPDPGSKSGGVTAISNETLVGNMISELKDERRSPSAGISNATLSQVMAEEMRYMSLDKGAAAASTSTRL